MKDKKIAVDSGIILDSNRVKQQWLLENLDLEFGLWEVNKTELEPKIGPEIYERMRKEIFTRENILAHPIVEGFDEFFKRFENNEIYMLTVKTPNYIPYLIEWLHKKPFPYTPQILTAYDTTKTDICKRHGIDIIIDDDIRHLREISSLVERIFFKPKQKSANLDGVVQVGSWKEVADYLDKKY